MVAFFGVQSYKLRSDIVYFRLYLFSLSCISKYNNSLAKKFLVMMCNKFSAGERDAGRAEEFFWMHLKACRKSPKPFYFILNSDTEQAAGCLSQQSP